MPHKIIFRNLGEAFNAAESLKRASAIEVSGNWSLYENLVHCTQSIEFSMKGFPEKRSWIFRHALGPVAFRLFAARGFMKHNTNEAIPGSPPIITVGDSNEALENLLAVMREFESFSGKCYPHFAYGHLSKSQYAKAHAMHLANHYETFSIQ